MSSSYAVQVENLAKCYRLFERPMHRVLQMLRPGKSHLGREFWALRGVSFAVQPGEAFGIVGRNGSGKSTLLQILAGTLSQTHGTSHVNGRIAALLELGSGFNPAFTGRENVFLNGRILGMTKAEIQDRYERILDFADIGDFIDQPIRTYSSGMFLRLAFAVQAHVDASVVIIDEALAVGDVFFRQKCYARLEQLRKDGAAVLLVSHAMSDVEQYCQRALVLDHGKPFFLGSATEAVKHYYLLHQSAKIPVSTVPETSTEVAPLHTTPTGRDGSPGASMQQPQSATRRRPPEAAFFDLSKKSQVSLGLARCTGVALCNTKGEPCFAFQQGETACFYSEFELAQPIEVPVCGITLNNDKGIIVHGKSSLQGLDTRIAYAKGARTVCCYQQIKLDLMFGEYTFEVGFASISRNDWDALASIPFEAQDMRVTRLCHIPDIGPIAIHIAMRNGISFLPHHGIADLPGAIRMDMF